MEDTTPKDKIATLLTKVNSLDIQFNINEIFNTIVNILKDIIDNNESKGDSCLCYASFGDIDDIVLKYHKNILEIFKVLFADSSAKFDLHYNIQGDINIDLTYVDVDIITAKKILCGLEGV
jgi:hypothetical protein